MGLKCTREAMRFSTSTSPVKAPPPGLSVYGMCVCVRACVVCVTKSEACKRDLKEKE